jgi:hypothetical protein
MHLPFAAVLPAPPPGRRRPGQAQKPAGGFHAAARPSVIGHPVSQPRSGTALENPRRRRAPPSESARTGQGPRGGAVLLSGRRKEPRLRVLFVAGERGAREERDGVGRNGLGFPPTGSSRGFVHPKTKADRRM